MKNLMKKGTVSMLVALLMVFVLASCNKDEPATSQEILEETAFAENVFAQLDADVEDAMPVESISSGREESYGFGFGFGNCMTRTVDKPEDDNFPKVITIEYDGTCTSNFGVVKSGKIIITLTGHPNEEGSQRIVTFENFTVNGNLIEGTKTITFMGNGQYTSTLTGGKLTTAEGNVVTRASNRTRTIIAGQDTEDRSDNVYEVTGSTNGETTGGISYNKEIIEPLIVSRDCFWITKGIVETTIGEVVFTVDFGDGTCDNIATKIENGEEEEFTMEMRIRKMWLKRWRHHNSK